MITDTVHLTAYGLGKVADAVKAANKIAKRAGLQPVSYKVIGSEKRTYKDFNGGWDFQVEWFEVEVSGEPVKVDGWEFLASIEHTENGNIMHSHSQQNLPEQYRTSSSRTCDVCHTNRERKQTYIVCKDGQYKQVGSSCLKDFFGVNVNAVAKLFDEWRDIVSNTASDEDMDEYIGSGGSYEVSLASYMSYVVKVIRENGYVSRKNVASNGGLSTADMVGNYMSTNEPKYRPSDADKAEAKAMIAEVQATPLNSNNDYEWNLSVLVKNEFISPKSYGLAASLPAFIGRIHETERKAALKNEFVQGYITGNEGDKITVNVKVLSVKEIAGFYGTTYLYKMVSEDNHIVTWFASSEKMSDGCTATVTGTIKSFTKFNGEYQTQLTRCKVSNMVEGE